MCAETGMDVLNALNFDPSNLALDLILLGALAVGFRDHGILLDETDETKNLCGFIKKLISR